MNISINSRFSATAIALAILMTLPMHRAIADAQSPLPLNQISTFAKVFETIKNQYVEEISDEELLQTAIRGMLAGLDPHSSFLDRSGVDELRIESSGEYGGLGIEITKDSIGLRVISPIDDTPAQAAGILPGDLIVRIDDRPVSRLTLTEAVGIMRGEPGTDITLTIVRQGSDAPLVILLTRAVIQIRSVRSFFLDANFGYLRVTQFQNPTPNLARQQLRSLFDSAESLNGIVLDLRNNPGGELNSAIGVSDLFIDQGVIVKTRARNNTNEEVFRATPGDLAKGVPIVVLVNEGSASASEIVAGALQDHRRAIIMGTKTFGKGSVQTIWQLDKDTSLKLTTHRYYTPSDRSIQALGIVPDIIVERREFPQAEDNEVERLREADLEGSLDNQNQSNQQNGEEDSAINPMVKQDYQLQEALNLLRGLHIVQQPVG